MEQTRNTVVALLRKIKGVIQQIHPQHTEEDGDGRSGHEETPRTESFDDEERLREEPKGKEQANSVNSQCDLHKALTETHTSQASNRQGNDDGLADQPEEGIRKAQQVGLPGLSDLAAGDDGVDVAGELGVGVLGQSDGID